jgi:mono/diheme cytochrome c family protein
MKLIWMLAFAPAILCAQNRGAEIFAKSCATGYCHGSKGTDGGAPRLAARGFDDAYISKTIRDGIEHTGMPAFGTEFSRPDFLAVAAYVDSLNGVTPPAAPGGALPVQRKLTPAAQAGREAFADQVRGLIRCSNCHQADGLGIAVTLPIGSVPDGISALKQAASPHVETATAEGDTFPVLALNKSGAFVKIYDLTIPPPVLRTFPKGTVTFKAGTSWRHSQMLTPYTDQELESILVFLRETAPKP